MSFYARLLSASPFIIMAGTGNGMLGPAWPLQKELPKDCFFLINFWTHFTTHTASNLRLELMDYYKLYPNRKFLFLANELSQLWDLQKCGIPAIMGNHNIFIDERIFDIDPLMPPQKFEAIYNARMNDEKRHLLCRDLRSVAFLYYFNPPDEFNYFNKVKESIPTATFLNGDPQQGTYRHFTPDQCAASFRASQVGLCLSEAEGAMLSSIEYLFCGIPVVTTPNRGGRNYLFRPEFSIEAEPLPWNIAQAVDILVKRQLDPRSVRAAALSVVLFERKRFFQDVTRWLSSEAVDIDFEDLYTSRYVNRMWETFLSAQDFYSKHHQMRGFDDSFKIRMTT